MKIKRLTVFFIAVFVLFLVSAFRLFQLQIMQGDEMQAKATAQRVRQMEYYQYARGDILDRKERSMVNVEENCVVILPAVAANNREEIVLELSHILHISKEEIASRIDSIGSRTMDPCILKTGVTAEQLNGIEQANLPGVVVLSLAARYPVSQSGAHFIGYVQQVGEDGMWQGICGLEQIYDDYLQGRKDDLLSVEVDAAGSLCGQNFVWQKVKQKEFNTVHLTIDRDYQEIAEQVFLELGYEGCCVIMDPQNGDILAMVSAPTYDAYGWEEPKEGTYVNKALSLYHPASTFKIVLTAAALNEEVMLVPGDESMGSAMFNCSGSYQLPDQRMVYCAGHTGHGDVDMASAFAVSCNCYFVALGQQLGGNLVREYAEKLGFDRLQITGYPIEGMAKDDFLYFNRQLPGELANVSLGENGIQVSAVQEASLISACVNGGFLVQPRLVTKITDQEGQVLEEFPTGKPAQVMRTEVAETLRLMLMECVENGTGSAAQGPYFNVGGKTGSSETGNVWFSGFMPAEVPKLVISVCVEEGSAGGVEAAAVFRLISERIALLDGKV